MREHYLSLNLIHQVRGGYLFHEQVGYGGFSIVHRCTHIETGRIYAVKVLWMGQYTDPRDAYVVQDDVRNEVDFLRRVRSTGGPFIDIVDEFQEGGYWYIVMRLADKGDLDAHLGTGLFFQEHEVADVMLDVFTGLQILHDDLGIAHLDIKPENIFLRTPGPTGTCALIGDFGLSKPLDQDSPATSFKNWVGTQWYWAPEVFRTPYGPAADIWAAGMVMWRLLVGDYPVAGITDHPTSLKDAQYQVNVIGLQDNWLDALANSAMYVSENGWDFLKGILHIDPTKRLTAKQALAHEFLVNARTTRAARYRAPSPSSPPRSVQPSRTVTPPLASFPSSPPSAAASVVSSEHPPYSPSPIQEQVQEDGTEQEQEEIYLPDAAAPMSPSAMAVSALLLLAGAPRVNVSPAGRVASPARGRMDLVAPVRDDGTATSKHKRTRRQVTPKVHRTRAVTARDAGMMIPASVVPSAVIVPSAPKGKKVAKRKTAPKGKKAVPSAPLMQAKSARDLRAERRQGREVVVAPRRSGDRVAKR
ncbi:kinase-like domain-containing protein [Morchella snyderi]|nr:kinase-like domain-containing protein [Morchella snyderi]